MDLETGRNVKINSDKIVNFIQDMLTQGEYLGIQGLLPESNASPNQPNPNKLFTPETLKKTSMSLQIGTPILTDSNPQNNPKRTPNPKNLRNPPNLF